MQKQNLGKDSSSQTGSVSQIYDEFCPILLNQFKSRDYTKFETFDASLDEFYSKIESQRSEQQQKAKENSAAQKLNKIRQDQENRVHTLRKEADHCVKMAELIEYNLEDVDAAILAVHVALAKEILGLELAGISPVLYGRNDQLHIFNNKFKAIHSWAFTEFSSAAADSIHSDEDQLKIEEIVTEMGGLLHAKASLDLNFVIALGLAYQQLGRYTAAIKVPSVWVPLKSSG
ncbi:uncharacterized protein LOC107610760 [Arachis ipaensis]|uniref:uncharacterized protein LOC107610760 n=1 Tax=Arachis ipaensis TaxID=130454 RepID=UPI0007AEFB3C|nr:uncharacterized protein LOC107610760 [Arachis ipaensis]